MGYEACTTPPRNQCTNYGFNQNLGDGDYPYCQSSGSYRPGGSSSYRPAGGSSSYRPGGSNSYRPGRPGGNRNPPRRPSLGDILSEFEMVEILDLLIAHHQMVPLVLMLKFFCLSY